MKTSELRRLIERAGWVIVRNGANHDIYKHPNRLNERGVAVGRHSSQEIPKGTEQKILKAVGLKNNI